ncbi:MAG: hypothetical protein AAGF79_10995 [Pseudomonadota bacterium]
MIRILPLVLACLAAAPVQAIELDLPAQARALSERVSQTAHAVPVGPWGADGLPTVTATGRLIRQTWRMDAGLTTAQVLDPLVQQIEAAGYSVLYRCQARACGGFDFRFSIDVVPAPDMFVDLSDFQFVSAMNAQGDAVSLLVSAGLGGAWVQISDLRRGSSEAAQDRAQGLVETGRLVLVAGADLADRSDGADLEILAAVLARRADLRLAIVAHTGGAGEEEEQALTAAQDIRAQLIADFATDPDRVVAVSVGPFAPRTTSLETAGQALNRRIEAVLLPD